MSLEALLDGDIIAYRCASSCEQEDTSNLALYRVNELVERILANVGASTYTIYLSGGANFRKEIDPEYKANRKDKEKPKWLEACREFLVTQWNAKVTDGIEADDALGIAQREDTIICSLDKDLLQIPGRHYQWDISGTTAKGAQWTKEALFHTISPEEGLKRFWMQMLVGDVADNVVGVHGIGPVKATKLLTSVEGESLEDLDSKYYDIVANLYGSSDRLHRNAKLLWVLRSYGGIWLSPEERTEVDLKQTSQTPLELTS